MAKRPAYWLSRLAAACGVIMLPHGAFGQVTPDRHQSDAAGYPCTATLGVFGESDGFWIRPVADVAVSGAAPVSTKSIRIGSSMKLDAALLDRRIAPRREADHDTRR